MEIIHFYLLSKDIKCTVHPANEPEARRTSPRTGFSLSLFMDQFLALSMTDYGKEEKTAVWTESLSY